MQAWLGSTAQKDEIDRLVIEVLTHEQLTTPNPRPNPSEVVSHFKSKLQVGQGKRNDTDRRVRPYVTIGGFDAWHSKIRRSTKSK